MAFVDRYIVFRYKWYLSLLLFPLPPPPPPPDKLIGTVVKKNGQTLEDKVDVQAAVEFSFGRERIDFTKIICTLPGSGGFVYDGHLPNLGENSIVYSPFVKSVLHWNFKRGELRQFYFISYVSKYLYIIQGGPQSIKHLRSAISKTSSTNVIDIFRNNLPSKMTRSSSING